MNFLLGQLRKHAIPSLVASLLGGFLGWALVSDVLSMFELFIAFLVVMFCVLWWTHRHSTK